MAFLAGFLAYFLLSFTALIMAAYIDHRARRRVRTGELPTRMPWLILWFGWGIDPIYLFSPAFKRLQDRTTSWLVFPLRLIVGLVWAIAVAAIAALVIAIWLNPAA